MIKNLQIENYRSIQSAKVDFKPLTVFIGANGCGKSNVVKALEFISDIPKEGIHNAISKQGGANGIIPKAIPNKDLHKTSCKITYTMETEPPLNLNKSELPNLNVSHQFKLKFPRNAQPRVLYEELSFQHVLLVATLLANEDKPLQELREIIKEYPLELDSRFKLIKNLELFLLFNSPQPSTRPPLPGI